VRKLAMTAALFVLCAAAPASAQIASEGPSLVGPAPPTDFPVFVLSPRRGVVSARLRLGSIGGGRRIWAIGPWWARARPDPWRSPPGSTSRVP